MYNFLFYIYANIVYAYYINREEEKKCLDILTRDSLKSWILLSKCNRESPEGKKQKLNGSMDKCRKKSEVTMIQSRLRSSSPDLGVTEGIAGALKNLGFRTCLSSCFWYYFKSDYSFLNVCCNKLYLQPTGWWMW